MGWKGTLRSINAASKKANREAERRRREAQRRSLIIAKENLRAKAEELVEEHNSYLNFLTSFHKEISEPIDWDYFINIAGPLQPSLSHENELNAQNKFDKFKPNFLHSFLGSAESAKQKLKEKIDHARQEDMKQFEKASSQYKVDLETWIEDKKKAQKIKENDFETINNTLNDLNPFSDLKEVKIETSLVSCSKTKWVIESTVNDTTIIRGFERSTLRNGQLSSKPMTRSKVTALMEDLFSSVNIRIAREMFTLFPVQNLIVNTRTLSRSLSTGRLEPQLVLSCFYTRDKVNNIDFEYIDPSDYISNHLKYNTGFKKSSVVLTEEVTEY